ARTTPASGRPSPPTACRRGRGRFPTATTGSPPSGGTASAARRDGSRASWLARADDRRAGVRVNAVGLADVYVNEAGRGESLLELLYGQRPGDASSPLPHVGPGRLVHIRVRDHVADCETTPGAQHPRRLAQDT